MTKIKMLQILLILLSCLINSSSIYSQERKDYSLNQIIKLEKTKKCIVLQITDHNYESNRYYVLKDKTVIGFYDFQEDGSIKKSKPYFSERDSTLIVDYFNNLENIGLKYSKTGCVHCKSVVVFTLKRRLIPYRIKVIDKKVIISNYF